MSITERPFIFDLTGKVALVTGASRGIGFSIAQALARQGAGVILAGRNEEALNAAAEKLKAIHPRVWSIPCHVGREDQLFQLVDTAVQRAGTIDILVNNAAANPVMAPVETLDAALFDTLMQTNVKSAFLLSNLCFPYLRQGEYGSIIHIGSVEGHRPTAGLALYGVSKAALHMLARAQAKEWGQYNIRSNVIVPGLVQTKFSQSLWQNKDLLDQWVHETPLHIMAQPDDIAGAAVFLASGASSFCTGMELTADGGYLLS